MSHVPKKIKKLKIKKLKILKIKGFGSGKGLKAWPAGPVPKKLKN